MPEPNGPEGSIPPHGGFADLISYQKSACPIPTKPTVDSPSPTLANPHITNMKLPPLAAFAALALLTSTAAEAGVFHFNSHLSGAFEVPSNGSTGWGSATATYDTDTSEFGIGGLVGSLSSGITGANVRLGAPGVDGPVVIPVVPVIGLPGGPINSGIVILTPEQVSDLFGGLWYISVETADFPEGEIRGQIQLGGLAPIPEPTTWTLIAGGTLLGWFSLRRLRSADPR